jgi:hypothetical protein
MVIEGVAHHVVQRGNDRQDVFFVADDRRRYLALLKQKAADYAWSSAAAHLTGEDRSGLLEMQSWFAQMDSATWRRPLAREAAKEEVRLIRKCTERGWPLAGDGFLAKAEKLVGRRLRPLVSGRPKGAKDARQRKRTRLEAR